MLKKENMKRFALLLLLLCGLVNAAPKEAQLIEKAKTAAAYKLNDPDSAKFRNIVIVRGAVCGEMNAKNSMGGYTGYTRFLFENGTAVSDSKYIPVEFQELWDRTCEKSPKTAESPVVER